MAGGRCCGRGLTGWALRGPRRTSAANIRAFWRPMPRGSTRIRGFMTGRWRRCRPCAVRAMAPPGVRTTNKPTGVGGGGGGGARSMLMGPPEPDRKPGLPVGVPVALVTFGPEGAGVARLSPEALLDHYDDLHGLVERLLG